MIRRFSVAKRENDWNAVSHSTIGIYRVNIIMLYKRASCNFSMVLVMCVMADECLRRLRISSDVQDADGKKKRPSYVFYTQWSAFFTRISDVLKEEKNLFACYEYWTRTMFSYFYKWSLYLICTNVYILLCTYTYLNIIFVFHSPLTL